MPQELQFARWYGGCPAQRPDKALQREFSSTTTSPTIDPHASLVEQILKALVAATDLPIDAKIRLLPISAPSSPSPESESEPAPPAASEDPTLPLIREILSTGIKCLTVHCRTQTMRSSEPALHHRLLSINESLARLRREAQESCPGAEAPEWTKIPVVCNGDVTGGAREGTEEEGNEDGPDATPTDTWGNFDKVCRETGVASVMIARAAEANPSCFNSAGLEDPIKVVIPKMLRIVSHHRLFTGGELLGC